MNFTNKPYSKYLAEKVNEVKVESTIKIKPTPQNEVLFKMKPSIPKTKAAKSMYKEFYIRPLDSKEFVYHVASGLFVAPVKDGRDFVDRRYDEIIRRVNEVLDVEQSTNKEP
jgi:hypothetical protein